MSWLGGIRGLIGARWFPYVLIGWASSVLAAAGWSYIKGYSAAEVSYQAELSSSLTRQIRREREQSALELRLAIRNEREKYAVQRRINEVQRPAVSCELPAQCVHWYDAVLQAAEGDIERAD